MADVLDRSARLQQGHFLRILSAPLGDVDAPLSPVEGIHDPSMRDRWHFTGTKYSWVSYILSPCTQFPNAPTFRTLCSSTTDALNITITQRNHIFLSYNLTWIQLRSSTTSSDASESSSASRSATISARSPPPSQICMKQLFGS